MAVTAYRSPGTVTEDTSVGTATFTNPSNVGTVGAPATTIAWSTGTHTSSRLNCSNFNFAAEGITASDSIDGFEISYKRNENGTTDNLETKAIYPIDSGGNLVTAVNSADAGEWPTVATTTTVGGSTNKMGYNSATYADVTNSAFGFSFQCGTIGSGTTPDGSLDDFQMRIYYTPGGATAPSAVPNALMMMGCGT